MILAVVANLVGGEIIDDLQKTEAGRIYYAVTTDQDIIWPQAKCEQTLDALLNTTIDNEDALAYGALAVVNLATKCQWKATSPEYERFYTWVQSQTDPKDQDHFGKRCRAKEMKLTMLMEEQMHYIINIDRLNTDKEKEDYVSEIKDLLILNMIELRLKFNEFLKDEECVEQASPETIKSFQGFMDQLPL
jgi:hypothetical protein